MSDSGGPLADSGGPLADSGGPLADSGGPLVDGGVPLAEAETGGYLENIEDLLADTSRPARCRSHSGWPAQEAVWRIKSDGILWPT